MMENQEAALKSPNPPRAVATRPDDIVGATVVGVGVPSSKARLPSPGPKAVPSEEKVPFEFVANVGVSRAGPIFAGFSVFSFPEFPPLVVPVLEEPELEEDPPTLCPSTTPVEDKLPVTSEACAKEEKVNIRASSKNDFNNVFCFIISLFELRNLWCRSR